ncbi:TrkA family potassium uptake protein [Pasteurellaceae bacterium HPA106]|uniref:potassium channel family protein n=1 Tax=Spirabiliibacterium pneumoniae TaxID=221400 RepID=UPI001AAD91AA|nr:TrkA family potassium uptake protein [Spirabiliibacterium pneumoniae]MBE2896869.1 TrkA family potassium uptake protein [Spirabiliibacterium pneumoniae]
MQFAVIGLGKFGLTAALELQGLDNTVTAIDHDEKLIEKIGERLRYAVIADSTDKSVLEELNITDYDAVLVAIGSDIEASLLTVLNLQSLHVKNIWVKAKNQAHATVLKGLGVVKVIEPEQDMGIRIAQAMNYPMVSQYMPLGDNYFLIKIVVSSTEHSLAKLQHKYPHDKFVGVMRDGQLIPELSHDFHFMEDDRLLVIGELESLRKLALEFKV